MPRSTEEISSDEEEVFEPLPTNPKAWKIKATGPIPLVRQVAMSSAQRGRAIARKPALPATSVQELFNSDEDTDSEADSVKSAASPAVKHQKRENVLVPRRSTAPSDSAVTAGGVKPAPKPRVPKVSALQTLAAAAAAVPATQAVLPATAPTANTRCRNWAFTMHPGDANSRDVWGALFLEQKNAKYVIIGLEHGKIGETPHLQGTVVFNTARTFNSMKSIANTTHWEMCRDLFASIEYCKKEGNFREWGVAPLTPKAKGAKERTRWDLQYQLAAEGRESEMDAQIRFVHARTVEFIHSRALRGQNMENIPFERKQLWFVGTTGTGKSSLVRKMFDQDQDAFYNKPIGNKWWDGASNQPFVLFDDLGMENYPGFSSNFKAWSDIYPFHVEIKGNMHKQRPQLLVVTSNFHPREVFSREPRDVEAVMRRFDIVWFPEVDEPCPHGSDMTKAEFIANILDNGLHPLYKEWKSKQVAATDGAGSGTLVEDMDEAEEGEEEGEY